MNYHCGREVGDVRAAFHKDTSGSGDWYLITYSDSDQKYAPFLDSSTILTNGLQTYDISEELNLAKRLTNEEETEDLIAWNIPFKVLNPADINDELVNIINQLVIATRLRLWHYYK